MLWNGMLWNGMQVLAQSNTSTSTPVSDPKQTTDAAGNQVVQIGSKAGVYYTVWETLDAHSFPDEAISAAPVFSSRVNGAFIKNK